MIVGLRRALAFARGWKSGVPGLREEAVEIHRGDRRIPGALLLPEGRSGPLPGWVILHGITRPGPGHPTLQRFARAMAGSGAAVLVPEIPEWRELHLAPEQVSATIRASVLHLDRREEVGRRRTGVIGFSFGAPQAIIAATHPSLKGHLAAVVGFGGYCRLEELVAFLFSGRHEWEGRSYVLEPDPYGRWVVGGNYLDRTPGYEEAEDVSRALLELARMAGDIQVGAWEPIFDTRKDELEEAIHPSRRELFRAFAPAAGQPPDREIWEPLAPVLARTIRASSPLAEAPPFLHRLDVPVRLIHGREDRLIPFSETLRLGREFPPDADIQVFLTGLFSHSQRGGTSGPLNKAREAYRFLRALSDIMELR